MSCAARSLHLQCVCLQMDQRMSSGMEPAHAKRQHLSPAELQQRLSHLVGRPLGAQEMSRLIPNFPDLLEEHSSIGQAPFRAQV